MPSRAYAAVAVAIVALAAVAITVLVRTESAAAECRDAAADILLVRQGKIAQSNVDPAVRRLRDGCTDSDAPAQAAVNLAGIKRRGQAVALAREVTRAEPDNYRGWLILSAVLGPQDRAEARRARARARALNPLLPR